MATSIWDVNKYRSEFESEEHWQLRKKFMETHVDKFSEDKLVCLARVFFNIEFLGCRYPEKTMRLIAELSKGVADEHREKQKGKLKRTFVQASDAAGAKIKGSGIQIKDEPPDKKPKTSEERIGYCSAHSNLTKPPSLPKLSGEFSDLIIFENCNKLGKVDSCPITILNNTVQKNGPSNTIAYSVLGRRCDIKINNKLLASEEASTVKEAKLNAAIKGLKLLRKSCFTIQGKRAFFSNEPSITKDSKVTDSEGPLPEHNIGSKMMRKMGWTGSGLGKSQQGIQDPVQASPQIMHRAGFGSVNEKELQNKFRTLFKDYIKSNSEHDLLFSPDFTIEERKTLHKNISDVEGDDASVDLFGSDTEIDLTVDTEDFEVPNDSLNSQVLIQDSLCIVCSKLKLITGEETDNDVYDTMWSTDCNTNEGDDINNGNKETHSVIDEFQGEPTNAVNESVSQSMPSDLTKAVPVVSSNSVTTFEKFGPNPRSKVRFFFPDGSFIRFNLKTIVSNEVIKRYLYPENTTPRPFSQHIQVSKEDLMHIPGLAENFKKFENLRKYTSSQNENLMQNKSQEGNKPALEKLKIFLPDGSYKRIATEKVLADNELIEFTKCSDGKTDIPYRHFATIQDLKTNSALKKFFSDFLSSCKLSQNQLEVSKVQREGPPLVKNINEKHNEIFTVIGEASNKHIGGSTVVGEASEKHNTSAVVQEPKDMPKYETDRLQVDTDFRDPKVKSVRPLPNSAFVLTSLKNCINMYQEGHNYTSRIPFQQSFKRQRNKRVDVFLPDGSKKRVNIKSRFNNKQVQDIFNNLESKPITDEDFIHCTELRKIFYVYWSKIKDKLSNGKFQKEDNKTENSKPTADASQTNPLNMKGSASKNPLLNDDNNMYRFHTSTVSFKKFETKKNEGVCGNYEWPSTSQAVKEIKCTFNDESTRNQAVTEAECDSDDKCAANQDVPEIKCGGNKSSTKEAVTEVNSDDKCAANKAIPEIKCGANKSSTNQAVTATECSSYDNSLTIQSATESTCFNLNICDSIVNLDCNEQDLLTKNESQLSSLVQAAKNNKEQMKAQWSTLLKHFVTPENTPFAKNIFQLPSQESKQEHNLSEKSENFASLAKSACSNLNICDSIINLDCKEQDLLTKNESQLSSLVQAAKNNNEKMKAQWSTLLKSFVTPENTPFAKNIFQLPSQESQQEHNVCEKSEDFASLAKMRNEEEIQQNRNADNNIVSSSSIELKASSFATTDLKTVGVTNDTSYTLEKHLLEPVSDSTDLQNHIYSSAVTTVHSTATAYQH